MDAFVDKGLTEGGHASLPDIDVDYASDRRQEIKDYLEERYNADGRQRVFSAGTFTTMKLKAALKDVARVHRVPHSIVNYITAMIDDGTDWTGLFRQAAFNRKLRDFIQTYPLVIEDVQGLLGQPKAASIHASAIVVTPDTPEHQALFEQLVADKSGEYEEKFSVKYDVSFSIQKPSTDTVAAAMDNTPFRDKNDKLLFRPGGHGALIENLNDVDADVVFIKNIDNVVPDSFKCSTVIYKKVIAGVLVTLQEKAFRYLEQIETGKYTHAEVEEMIHFLQDDLCIKNPDTKLLEDAELILYIKSKLLRPLRVCGMVKNVGEPGGGPFLAVNPDGTVSLQVLESSQIDMSDPAKKAMFEKGTHFNPVDLVCAVKNHKGEKYNLPDYVDKNTGFISYKSKDGRELKALELPGLWNGAMSDWNTVFVEVPIETFNPVKTVNDLLRPEHQ